MDAPRGTEQQTGGPRRPARLALKRGPIRPTTRGDERPGRPRADRADRPCPRAAAGGLGVLGCLVPGGAERADRCGRADHDGRAGDGPDRLRRRGARRSAGLRRRWSRRDGPGGGGGGRPGRAAPGLQRLAADRRVPQRHRGLGRRAMVRVLRLVGGAPGGHPARRAGPGLRRGQRGLGLGPAHRPHLRDRPGRRPHRLGLAPYRDRRERRPRRQDPHDRGQLLRSGVAAHLRARWRRRHGLRAAGLRSLAAVWLSCPPRLPQGERAIEAAMRPELHTRRRAVSWACVFQPMRWYIARSSGPRRRGAARRATPSRIASVLAAALHIVPALLLPLGAVTLARTRTTAARAACVGCIAAGAAWIYEGWQYLSCEGEPEPCGAPDWLDTFSAV